MLFLLYFNGKAVTDKILLKKFSTEEDLGVFESLRTYGRKIFRLEEHVKRFMESARTAGFAEQINALQIHRELERALSFYLKAHELPEQEDLFLRVTWLQGEIFVMVGRRKHSETLYREGIALKTTAVKRTLTQASPAEAKTSAYQNAVLATLELQPAYEWVFLDRAGYVTEVRIGNLFIVKDGGLLTPPTQGILNGVTRRFVIECALQLKIPVKEVPITRHEVFNADEAFLTNTSWEILPVKELDGRKIGLRIPGLITSKLQQTFKKKVLQSCH